MPKLLQNPEEAFVAHAAQILRSEGYAALSIRRLAGECHTASGTVYNYFRNKDELVARVMMADWRKSLAAMEEAAQVSQSFSAGVRGMYRAIAAFVARYEGVWNQYASGGGSGGVVTSHHAQLRGQIAAQLATLLERMANAALLPVAPLLAETLLAAAVQPDLTEAMLLELTDRLTGDPTMKG